MTTSPDKLDRHFQELEPGHRVYRSGAWNLQGVGVYVEHHPDRVVIGHRPGPVHYTIGVVFPALAVAIVVFVLRVAPELWWLAAFFGLLFGVFPVLPLLNTQRFEICQGVARMRGRAMGFRIRREFRIPRDAAVRIEQMPFLDGATHPWRRFQVQIRTEGGWLALAELLHEPEPLRQFAERVSEVTECR